MIRLYSSGAGDGHWWPESYYLGILQAREALYEVGVTADTKNVVFTKIAGAVGASWTR